MQSKLPIYFYSIKTSEQTSKFGNIVVNKKEFNDSKQAIAINLVNTNKVFTSDKLKHSDDCLNILLAICMMVRN